MTRPAGPARTARLLPAPAQEGAEGLSPAGGGGSQAGLGFAVRCLLMGPGAGMAQRLNELPDHSARVRGAVAELRRRAEAEPGQRWPQPLSDAFLVRFLRDRDFNLDLAWRVRGSGSPQDTGMLVSAAKPLGGLGNRDVGGQCCF